MPSDAMLKNLVDITPRTPSTEASGGTGWTNGTPTTSVPCSIQKPKPGRELVHGKEGQVCDRIVYFGTSQGVLLGWQLTPTGTSTKYYALTNEYDASAGMGSLYAVPVEERS